jgi:ketosteroid isomerase-like protein
VTRTAKQTVQRYLDALVAGDITAIRDSFAEDATWSMHSDLPIAGPWKGRDAIVDDFLSTVGGELYEPGSVSFEFPLLIAEGDTVVLEWRVHARTRAGRSYANEYCGVFIVQNGRIQTVREYLDTRYAAQILFADVAHGRDAK